MTRHSLSSIYIFSGILNFAFAYVNTEIREIKCTMPTEDGKTRQSVHQTHFISADNFTSITEREPPSSDAHMPTQPKDLGIDVSSNDNLAIISWYSPNYKWQNVSYFLLKIEEIVNSTDQQHKYTRVSQHEYILVNVRGLQNAKFECDYKLRNESDSLESTVWAIDAINYTESGLMTADVDENSKSHTDIKTNKEHIQREDEANNCICSKLHLSTKDYPSCMTFGIKSETLLNGTKIKIQLLKSSNTIDVDFVEREVTVTMNRNYQGKFNINITGCYIIRVQQVCNTNHPYVKECRKTEAEVIRSNCINISSSDSSVSEQSTVASKMHKTLRLTQETTAKSLNIATKQMEPDTEDIYKIKQLVLIVFAYGLTAIIETVIIFKVCSVLICSRKKSPQLYKHPTCVTVDDWGRTTTRVLKPRRAAIIFTKDTVEHVSRVYQLKSSLRGLGIDATPYDESSVPEMRLNWIQVGEKIATESDIVLFIVSPLLIKLCKRHDTSNEIETDINVLNSPLHKLPVVVLNSLKVGNIMSGESKPKVISVYLSERNSSIKHMVSTMRRDHPSLVSDNVILEYNKEDNEIKINHIKRLADKIKS